MDALVLIEIQNDRFPGGRMELKGSVLAAKRAGKALEAFRSQGKPLERGS